MVRLTFLGTGTSQGVPMIGCDCDVCLSADEHDKRLRSSVMIEYFDDSATSESDSDRAVTRVIIDAGPDFRYQMLREKIKSIDAIILTHEHRDHISGIDDIRAFNYFDQRATPIYATDRVADAIKREYYYAFGEHRYPGVPEIDLHIINEMPFQVGGLNITPIFGTHLNLPVTGYRIGEIAYLTDFNHIDNSEINKIKGIRVLILNALRHETHISHFSVSEAIEVSRLAKAKQTYFTHMSHQIGLHEDIKDSLPDGIEFAYDGLKIEVND